MMNYQGGRYARERKIEKRKKRAFFGFLILLVFIFGSGIQKGLLLIGEGIWSYFDLVDKTLIDVGYQIHSKKELIAIVVELEEWKKSQLGISEKNYILEQENAYLKRVATDTTIIPTSVFKRPPDSAYDELFIGIGRKLGVAPGDKVMASGHVIIGEISQALNDISIVTMYSTSGQVVDGILFDSQTPVKVKGEGGGMYTIEVLRDINVEKGDIVGYSGIGTPVLGVVEEVVFSPQDPFKKVFVRSPINIYEVSAVGIKIHQE